MSLGSLGEPTCTTTWGPRMFPCAAVTPVMVQPCLPVAVSWLERVMLVLLLPQAGTERNPAAVVEERQGGSQV